MSHNAAVLVGNGLSIAFNPGLNLQTITKEVMRRIEAADGNDVIAAMKEIAERALPDGVTSADDFEQLVGAFGSESRTLSTLETLASLTTPKDKKLLKAIRKVASFAEKVRDNGISHVLEVICERSRAYVDDAANLHDLVSAIATSFNGKVVFGNLNYDTLLLAAMLHVFKSSELADLADGRRTVRVTVNDWEPRDVQALRRDASDFPSSRRIRLLHLHGSLTYWVNRDHSIHAKLPKELLDDRDQWEAVRKGTTDVRPAVVLANPRDKAQHVGEYPFSLAYEMFSLGLESADHWLIIGYSFKDAPVNKMLSDVFLDCEENPTVLVVTYGESPTRLEVERAFGWGADDGDSKDWLTINRRGANGVQDTKHWQRFIS
ncbi:SIR2 family protein [Agreia sp. PsM10]|uniref:SIR2 family protein n=1 Tax=Agreia sp. PsM10 TaxID=3030533 RepID=UPI00263A4383|nr:SIR2 family protein [Agreia sp. PsM10]MDN4640608.1 SIR2 family protein [Agreia sp. PsM10]